MLSAAGLSSPTGLGVCHASQSASLVTDLVLFGVIREVDPLIFFLTGRNWTSDSAPLSLSFHEQEVSTQNFDALNWDKVLSSQFSNPKSFGIKMCSGASKILQ